MAEYIGGQLLQQGLGDFANGVKEYAQNKRTDAVVTGQIEAMLPQLKQAQMQLGVPSNDALDSLVDKFTSGNARLNDKMALLGQLNVAKQGVQEFVQNQQTSYALNRQRMVNNLLNQAFSSDSGAPQGQPNPQAVAGLAPGGNVPPPAAPSASPSASPAPAPNVINPPPRPLTIDSPQVKPMFIHALAYAGGDFDKAATMLTPQLDALNKQQQSNYDQAVAATKDTGRLIFDHVEYGTNGMPMTDVYRPEIVKAPGTQAQSFTRGDKEISYAHGTPPPVPFVMAPGEGKGQFTPEQEQQKIAALGPNNPNAPEWQKDLKQSRMDMRANAETLGAADALVDAAKAYATGGLSRFNQLRGNPKLASLFQTFGPSGTNPMGALQTTMAQNTRAILQQVRSTAGQTIGGRMLQTEFEKTAELLANPDLDNPTIVGAAKNVQILAQRAYDWQAAYTTARETMPEGEAAKTADRQFGAVPKLINIGSVYKVPDVAAKFLKANAGNPEVVRDFEAKYGFGLADLAMVK